MKGAFLKPNMPLPGRDTVIHFDEGLIGFSEFKEFQVLENDNIAPFRLLQAAHSRELGFLVLEPSSVVKDYYEWIPIREWDSIGLMPGDPYLAFVICIVGKTPKDSTGNFQAPLIINYKTMTGRQVILTEAGMSVRQPLV